MQPIHNLILIVLLTATFTSILTYAFRRLRRMQRQLDAHEEAERLASLPAEDEPQHRRHLRLVPAIGAIAGAVGWARSHPAIAGITLAAGAAAATAALIGSMDPRQPSTTLPSAAAPIRPPTQQTPPSVTRTPSASPSSSQTAPEPHKATLIDLPSITQVPRTTSRAPTTTGASASTTSPPAATPPSPPPTSTTSAPGEPPATGLIGTPCLVTLDLRPLIGLCLL
jgi:hypothetical protein